MNNLKDKNKPKGVVKVRGSAYLHRIVSHKHGHEELRIEWCGMEDKDPLAVIHRSGDGCIELKIPKKYLYPGDEVANVIAGLQHYLKEDRREDREAERRYVASSAWWPKKMRVVQLKKADSSFDNGVRIQVMVNGRWKKLYQETELDHVATSWCFENRKEAQRLVDRIKKRRGVKFLRPGVLYAGFTDG